jgi:HAD superfamily hydrolase (TIGR01509 family)
VIKAVIFDLDGVLIDSEALNVQSVVDSFRKVGIKLEETEKNYIIGRHSTDYLPIFGKNHGISSAMQKTIDKLRHENYHALWDKVVTLMPGAKQAINYLKSKKITIVLATSSSRNAVNKFLNKFDQANTFSLIITKDDVARRKPDPQIYNLAKEKVNLKGEEILVVEDTQMGIEAAKAAGLVCVAIPNKYTKTQDFSKADYILRSLVELQNIIFPF